MKMPIGQVFSVQFMNEDDSENPIVSVIVPFGTGVSAVMAIVGEEFPNMLVKSVTDEEIVNCGCIRLIDLPRGVYPSSRPMPVEVPECDTLPLYPKYSTKGAETGRTSCSQPRGAQRESPAEADCNDREKLSDEEKASAMLAWQARHGRKKPT